MRVARRAVSVLLVLFALAEISGAITTFEVEVTCPICGTKNKFYDYASWGSYVYQYPSKYQLVFWPSTDPTSWYICQHCHLSLAMWDFKEFPKEKVAVVKAALQGVKVEKKYKEYGEVPMSVRLEIAEKVYRLLDKDDGFWAHFYRVAGYHLAYEGKATEAAEARKHALEYIQRVLDKNAEPGHRKELLLASAAMKHFLGDDLGCDEDLETAAALTYGDSKIEAAKTKGYDAYLSQLIADYRTKLKVKAVPADLPTDTNRKDDD
ncbi:MAG TPA: hypothetical protein VLA96_00325 [Terriglobales bacterium]|nr:hypothetical protein [Terriglobales bacterium]